MIERGFMWRVGLVAVVLLAAWSGLAARLGQLHLGENPSLQARITRLHNFSRNLRVGRGRILDRQGNLLALDLTLHNVVVDPSVICSNQQAQVVSAELARALQLPFDEVYERVNRPSRLYEAIARNVHDDVVERVASLKLTGVRFEPVSRRHYPQGDLACHVIGFSNLEGVGSGGVEQRLDSFLKGREGFRKGKQDVNQRELYTRRSLEVEPQEGANVYLTIDQNIQYFADRALDDALTHTHAEAAWAIVQEVRTGAILAMASRPHFDLNEYGQSRKEMRMNRAVGWNFEPGSIFKVAVVAAALNEGLIQTNQVFDCENGLWVYAKRSLRDYRPHGLLDVTGILRKSSNIGTAKIALLMGDQMLYDYLKAFGVGERTGIELPGEEAGLLHSPAAWHPISITRIAMGHEVSLTALQMLNVMCAIGNDGFLMKPYIVEKVVDNNGTVLRQNKPEALAQPIRERTAAVMRSMLAEVTAEGGTGHRGSVEGYTVAGKTGTAQKVLPGGGYADKENMASFIGMLPAERPEIGIIVVLDNPQPIRTGGATAAPVFAEIAAPTARYLDIHPVDASELVYYRRIVVEGP